MPLIQYEIQHIYPVNDYREHIMEATCWCCPEIDGWVVIHNSMDERETYEEGRKLQ